MGRIPVNKKVRSATMEPPITVRQLGRADYAATLRSMAEFTDTREPETPDEIWFLEHSPVFTLGINADRSHLRSPGRIPVVQVDRGGQVTYHGPGQLVAYTLIDLKRAQLSVRDLVSALENAMIETIAAYGVTAVSRRDAPGVYANDAKLGSIGLRVRHGCSYHGLALNVDMDLAPFSQIDPCGFPDLRVTQLIDVAGPAILKDVLEKLSPRLVSQIRSAA
jgi:lipoyl(octanoyl) transferase